jgi:hypothetical protein
LKKTISDVDPRSLAGKTAVVRVDFNVPLEGGEVTDDRRIEESVPTIGADALPGGVATDARAAPEQRRVAAAGAVRRAGAHR